MLPWMPYHFFKETFDGNLEDLSGQQVLAVCASHGSILFATSAGTIWSLDGPDLSATATDFDQNIPITHILAASYSSDVLFVQKREDCNDVHVRDYRNLEGEDLQRFKLPAGDIKFLHGSPKMTRVVYSLDAKDIYLYTRRLKGDPPPKLLDDPEGTITGLFVTNDEFFAKHIFVCVNDKIWVYKINSRGGIDRQQLDSVGCQPGVAALADQGRLLVPRNNSVAIFSRNQLEKLVTIDGVPRKVAWFRNYLVAAYPKSGSTSLKIYDIDTHCIFHSCKGGNKVKHILGEWGSLVMIFEDNSMLVELERDTDYKVGQLCGRYQAFSVALLLAKSAKMKPQAIADIHRRIGDSNYEHQAYKEAADEYIEAIGYLEPSYVITKFLEPQYAEHLCLYLEALHEKKCYQKLHTILRFNCYGKLHHVDKINAAVKQAEAFAKRGFVDEKGDKRPPFDIEAAVKTLNRAGFTDEALVLSRAFKLNKKTSSMLAKLGRFDEIFQEMKHYPADSCEIGVTKYGPTLLDNFDTNKRKEFARFVVKVCSTPIPESEGSDEKRVCDNELFAGVFTQHQDIFYLFLTELIQARGGKVCEKLWNNVIQVSIMEDIDNLPKLVSNPAAQYSQEQALIAIKEQTYELEGDRTQKIKAQDMEGMDELNHQIGRLHEALAIIYEKRGLYYEILAQADPEEIINICEKYGPIQQQLWQDGLQLVLKSKKYDLIQPMIAKIQENKVLTLLDLISILGTSTNILFGFISSFAIESLTEMTQEVERLQSEVDLIEAEVKDRESKTETFEHEYYQIKPTGRCSLCNMSLETPCVHFLCGHAFHERCLGERPDFCSMCCGKYEQTTRSKLEANAKARELADVLNDIQEAPDGFSVIEKIMCGSVFSPDLDEPTDADIEIYLNRLTESVEEA